MIRRLWNFIWSPSGVISLGVLLIAGFVAGILFWGGFHWALEATNEEAFCISCHEMRDNVYEEYTHTVHYSSASGVGAICSDCHVPKAWGPKMIRKIQASKELWGKLTGVIDTPEKFAEHRPVMAQREWARMKANDSLECRNCHREDRFDYALMEPKNAEIMKAGLEAGDTCIDCHKGIAHNLPDLSGGYKKAYEGLVSMAADQEGDGDVIYPITTISYYLDAAAAKAESDVAGQLLAATALTVLDRKGDAIKVRIDGWQQDEVDRIVYALRGHRIFEATLKKETVEAVTRLATETDPDTELVWHEVSLEAWIRPGQVVDDLDAIWAYSAEMYSANCAVCHSKPDPGHHLANQWIGVLKSMERFVALDKEQTRVLQKYLQLRAKDTGGAAHHE
ncbi:MAG TPA: pentaheme c-type cytochrome TorC [Rhodobacteraceae bacterium]|nr:pentaheme c-type cytochrome TorC [Paracoccaceae bacterium]